MYQSQLYTSIHARKQHRITGYIVNYVLEVVGFGKGSHAPYDLYKPDMRTWPLLSP